MKYLQQVTSTHESCLKELLSPEQVSSRKEDLSFYGKDWAKEFSAAPSLIIFPKDTLEVAKVIQYCAAERLPVVPSAGRTGLSGGATASYGEVVISVERMKKIFECNPYSRSLRVQAGVKTEKVIEEAAQHGLFFPVDFASKGSSCIGGNIATNAGGIRVIRWGNIRDWVFSLQVVTGSGEILEVGRPLIKNQTGFDLKHLFIGSEGTLGIITEATLRLTLAPSEPIRALIGVPNLETLQELVLHVRQAFPVIDALEYFSREALLKVCDYNSLPTPFPQTMPHYILLECDAALMNGRDEVEIALGALLERFSLEQVLVSQNFQHAQALLAYRERISETLSTYFTVHKQDISVPVGQVARFLSELSILAPHWKDVEVLVFGHLGDGNLHINVLKGPSWSNEEFFDEMHRCDQSVFQLVTSLQGSISAEHGVGQLKRDYLGLMKSRAELQYMRSIKDLFDPVGILNPGKLLPQEEASSLILPQ